MATEKRLIDLEKARNNVLEILDGKVSLATAIRISAAMAKETVDAVEVVHGRWIEHEDMIESYLADCTEVFYECSACGGQQVIGETPYCPNCGAQMDLEVPDGQT